MEPSLGGRAGQRGQRQMTGTNDAKERLAAILAADVVGYSRLMRADERATVATLDEFRGIFRDHVEAHRGRIVDMAGDSVLAVFESAIGAVTAASEAQAELAKRNEALSDDRKMLFRVGVNLGDILEKDDGTVYGDGVNVAARLESTASPGGINVSGTVFDSVRAKVPGSFAFMGEQELKNIADPVAVYHLGTNESISAEVRKRGPKSTAAAASDKPTVAVLPLKVISGDEDIKSLAEGLQQDLIGGLTRQTAIAVVSGSTGSDGVAVNSDGVDFRLEGSIRAVGERLRLSFTLLDVAAGNQAWSERYDRHLEDVFELEDEISVSVASEVRIRIKSRTFEKLRNTENEALSVPDLLSKAAGFFVSSYGHNDDAAEAIRTALAQKPDHSMATAMMVFCRYRTLEYTVLDVPEDVKKELLTEVERSLTQDPSSFFAHLIAAIIQQDLLGDYEAALVHAETALELNNSFSQASAMAGVVKYHLGEAEEGLRMLNGGIEAAPEDPHRFRHLRELAVIHFLSGDIDKAVPVLDRLVRHAPDLLRNKLVSVPILWHAGQEAKAAQYIEEMLRGHPELNQRNMRPMKIRDPSLASRFAEGYIEAGLPQ
jgi:adenylate cyclase